MLKIEFFAIMSKHFPKESPKHKFFPQYEPVIDFIYQIGRDKVISYGFFSDRAMPCIAIVYDDDELLTCPECGKEISNGFNFCPECGVKLK